jgi:thioredoxin-like negative regulator of GroEL
MRNRALLSLLICALSSGCAAQKPEKPAIPLLNDTTAYKAIYESDIPVLIEFCSPESLKEMTPIVAEISEKHKGLYKVVRLDGTKATDTMALFDVPLVPSLVFMSKKDCKHGKVLVGRQTKQDIEIFIDQSMIQCRE